MRHYVTNWKPRCADSATRFQRVSPMCLTCDVKHAGTGRRAQGRFKYLPSFSFAAIPLRSSSRATSREHRRGQSTFPRDRSGFAPVGRCQNRCQNRVGIREFVFFGEPVLLTVSRRDSAFRDAVAQIRDTVSQKGENVANQT